MKPGLASSSPPLNAPKLVTPCRMTSKRRMNGAPNADPGTGCTDNRQCLTKGRVSRPGAPGKGWRSARPCSRPSTRFVPVNSEDRQAGLMVHCARHGFVAAHTACTNRIHGLLSEYGAGSGMSGSRARVRSREGLVRSGIYFDWTGGKLLTVHLWLKMPKYSAG